MKYIAIVLFLVGLTGMAYATIESTPFDLHVSSQEFFEPTPNKHHLVMKPGESKQVAIEITNNDTKPHTIDLYMAKETPHPERSFVFEPRQLKIEPGNAAESLLTVSASNDADSGTTILHTLIAKSNTFGAKSFGFYVEVSDQPSEPTPDMVRRGGPGGMFSSATQFGLDEKEAFEKFPYDILVPEMPDRYLFQGIYETKQIIYSKQPVSSETRELEFWDDGGLLIRFFEEEYFTFNDYLTFLNPNEQQIRINEKDGIASESLLILSSSDEQNVYSNSRVTIFLDDILLRLESQMPLDQLLRIAQSVTKEQNSPIPESTPICKSGTILKNDKCVEAEPLCGPDTTYQDGICVVNKYDEKQTSSIKWGQFQQHAQKVKPPIKQIQSGVEFHNVKCNEGLQLVYKKTGNKSACVTIFTGIELVVRGWATDNRVMLGCTGDRIQKCYPDDSVKYRNDLYGYYFGDSKKELPSSDSFSFDSLHTQNACTDKPQICHGKFENGTQIRVSCDYPVHGCGVKSFDSYKVADKAIPWKKYNTFSASSIDYSEIPESLSVYKIDDLSDDNMIKAVLAGADGCKNKTEVCSTSRGISIDRTYSFGISVTDSDQYTLTINQKQAKELMSQIQWTVKDDLIYSIVYYNDEYYFLIISTFDHTRTPDISMRLIDVLPNNPLNLQKGSVSEYAIEIESWSTYGTDAKITLNSIQSAKDSRINTWIEPESLIIPERSIANATLFVGVPENARDGIYDIRIGGKANGNNAGLHCGNTDCPIVQIGDSNWSIQNYGSNSGRGIGGGPSHEDTWLELELDKKEYSTGDVAEIRAYLVNNGTKSIGFIPRELLITVIKTQPVGYYDQLYGIDARNESDEMIVLDPESRTLLARPFYWNQTTFSGLDDEQRLEPREYKMMAKFVGEGNNTWSDDAWFEVKDTS